MNTIINSYFKKHPISWELIRCPLLHPYKNVMKVIFRHQTLDGLPKHFPKKISKAPCTICYKAKITTINKITTVDTIKLQPGELVHMDFSFYNITSICDFTSILALVCAKTRII